MRIQSIKVRGKMKSKTQFKKMFYKLPKKARREMIIGFPENPMTLEVCWLEIKMDTKTGRGILERLGYKDDGWSV